MKLTTLISLLSLGAVGGAGAWLYTENSALRDRVAALENPLQAEGVEAGTESAASGLRGSGTRRELAELRSVTKALTRRMDTAEEGAREAAAASGETAEASAAALAAKPDFANAVREVVLDMATNDIDFRARIGTGKRQKLGKDAPFAHVADTLKLDSSQEAQMSKDLQEMQQELFGLLAEERDDGVVPMELIAKAEKLKEGDPKKAEVFMQLFTLKIPGEEDTYMQRAVKMSVKFRKKIDEYLRPEQLEILNAVEVDWFSVKFN